jgi:hypothetical protein
MHTNDALPWSPEPSYPGTCRTWGSSARQLPPDDPGQPIDRYPVPLFLCSREPARKRPTTLSPKSSPIFRFISPLCASISKISEFAFPPYGLQSPKPDRFPSNYIIYHSVVDPKRASLSLTLMDDRKNRWKVLLHQYLDRVLPRPQWHLRGLPPVIQAPFGVDPGLFLPQLLI